MFSPMTGPMDAGTVIGAQIRNRTVFFLICLVFP